jgi:hypothetical protein
MPLAPIHRKTSALGSILAAIMKNITTQFNQSPKWVTDKRKKTLQYSAAIVAPLPREVQNYLIGRGPELKAELGEFRQRQSKVSEVVVGREVSAIDSARAKH